MNIYQNTTPDRVKEIIESGRIDGHAVNVRTHNMRPGTGKAIPPQVDCKISEIETSEMWGGATTHYLVFEEL
jgi:hypothetical protein